MSKIMVIGGAGYIGSHVVKSLLEKNYHIILLDNFSKGHYASIPSMSNNITTLSGDLGDAALLNDIFLQHKITVVMHFAAMIEVAESVQNPAAYYLNNVVKVYTLLEEMRKHKISNFIFSSTAATFGIPHSDLIDEHHSQIPINPYGHSKLMVEQFLKDYAYAYPDFVYMIFRYFNACGGDPQGRIGYSYHPPSHLLPVLMEVAAGNRDEFKIFGNDYATPDGTCIRDYVHVSDIANAHILGMEKMLNDRISDHFNLGTGYGTSVKEMVDLAKKITKINFNIRYDQRRPGDPDKLVCNPKKANTILDWHTKYSLSDMIQSAWYWINNKTY